MRRLNKHKSNSGFTMIEVLVTLIILSIGLLGLAGLQASSMSNNHNAYLKSQSTLLANDMADRLRANIVGVRAGNYNNASGMPGIEETCLDAGCAPDVMAAHDTHEWNTTLAQQLPAGQGTVTSDDAATFVITVRWDGNRNRATGTDCDPADADDLKCTILNITL